MLDIEATGACKLDNYQNFAKAFRVPDYSELMGAVQPNAARLKTAAEFKRNVFGDTAFGRSILRALLYALRTRPVKTAVAVGNGQAAGSC